MRSTACAVSKGSGRPFIVGGSGPGCAGARRRLYPQRCRLVGLDDHIVAAGGVVEVDHARDGWILPVVATHTAESTDLPGLPRECV
jgi:hypothetical protein